MCGDSSGYCGDGFGGVVVGCSVEQIPHFDETYTSVDIVRNS